MAKFNPSTLQRPDGITETKTFVDPNHPEAELTLTVTVSPDAPYAFAQQELRDRLVEDYVTGRNGGPPAPLPPIGGRAVHISKNLVTAIAALILCETPADGEDPYDFMQWLTLSVTMPIAFREIVEWVGDLTQKVEPEAKN